MAKNTRNSVPDMKTLQDDLELTRDVLADAELNLLDAEVARNIAKREHVLATERFDAGVRSLRGAV